MITLPSCKFRFNFLKVSLCNKNIIIYITNKNKDRLFIKAHLLFDINVEEFKFSYTSIGKLGPSVGQ